MWKALHSQESMQFVGLYSLSTLIALRNLESHDLVPCITPFCKKGQAGSKSSKPLFDLSMPEKHHCSKRQSYFTA